MFYQYIFEGVFSDQLGEYIDKCLEKFFYGFKKAHLTQHVLFCLLQTCQKELENSRMIRTVLMDLSKAYDCILHDLNVAKSEPYDLDKTGLISQRSSRLQLHQKKKTLVQVFSCECREIFKNTFFYRIPPVAAFEYQNSVSFDLLFFIAFI